MTQATEEFIETVDARQTQEHDPPTVFDLYGAPAEPGAAPLRPGSSRTLQPSSGSRHPIRG